MKILILYYSKSGNTKRVAESIHSYTSNHHDSTLMALKKVSIENLRNYDLLFIGAPCQHATIAKQMRVFLKTLP